MSTRKWAYLGLALGMLAAFVGLIVSPVGKELPSIPGTHVLYPHDMTTPLDIYVTRGDIVAVFSSGEEIVELEIVSDEYVPGQPPPSTRHDIVTIHLSGDDPNVIIAAREMRDRILADTDTPFDHAAPRMSMRIRIRQSEQAEGLAELVYIVEYEGDAVKEVLYTLE